MIWMFGGNPIQETCIWIHGDSWRFNEDLIGFNDDLTIKHRDMSSGDILDYKQVISMIGTVT